MNSEDPVGIIEFGNANIKCLIFKIKNGNNFEILSTSIAPIDGIHNDTIVNLKKASKAIRSCIGIAEEKAKISLKKISLIFEQPDFLCTKFSKRKKIDGSKIHKDDIEFLLREAKKQLILNDKNQFIIHIFNYNYIVDGKTFTEEPIDVHADSLTHEMTFITTPKNNIKNINQAFIDCDIEIERFISRTFASGVELLNKNELESGSIIIDFGFEKISLGLFKNLALTHSITLPIGVNHIAKDISKVCSLSLEESEGIRNSFDFLFQDNNSLFDENDNLKKDFFVKSNFRKISKNLILKVIKARIDEIFKLLKKQLIVPEFNLQSGIDMLLMGHGSKLINLEKYFENFFGLNVKVEENNLEKNLNSCIGALKIIKDGWETEALPELETQSVIKTGFFAKIFGIR